VLYCIDTFLGFPWFKGLVAGLTSRRLDFYPRSFHVGFVVNKLALGQVFLQVLLFSFVITIPPILHINLYLSTRRTSGPILGAFKLSNPFLGVIGGSIG
jgi:hypothetical protein